MEQYIVSARKYRPATFKSVVGQEALTTTLKNAIATNHLAHAYLFCGPRGVGKTTCARIFAKTINCAHPTPDGEACNECESCRGFNEQRSFNIHELDAASNNSVDDIRSLVEQVRIPPQVGKYSVYIIDEVHMLSTAAFNAFLKTLEEPPSYAIFILATTEKHKIIPTILSRCQIYDFNRIRIDDAVKHLQYVAQSEGVTADPEALNVIAQKADGAMRDALSIFDQVVSFCGGNVTYRSVIENLNVLDYDYYFRLTDDFLAGQVTHSLVTFDEILRKGFDAQYFITGLAEHFRNLLVAHDAATKTLLEVGAAVADNYVAQAQRCPIPFLYKALEITNECDLNYRVSRNKRLLVELTLIRLCQLTGVEVVQEPVKTDIIKPLPQSTETLQQPVSQPIQEPVSKPQPAVVSQPSVAPVSQQQTAQPASTPKPKYGMSITTLTTDIPVPAPETQSQSADTVPSSSERRNAFSDYDFVCAWKDFAATLSDDAHATNTLLNCLPVKDTDERYSVFVFNTLQQKELEKYRDQILASLRQHLNNDYIDFAVCVTEQQRDEAFTPEERFTQMRQQNPCFDQLSQQLGLELI
ncbi:MAG: DNA polymerase III subunit gamma/tau [Paludibacteraceae bacterium]